MERYSLEKAQAEARIMEAKMKSAKVASCTTAEETIEKEKTDLGEQLLGLRREILGLYDKNRKNGWDEESEKEIIAVLNKRDAISKKLAELLDNKLFNYINSNKRIRVITSSGKDHMLECPVLYVELPNFQQENIVELGQSLAKINMKISLSGNSSMPIREAKIWLDDKKSVGAEKEEFENLITVYRSY